MKKFITAILFLFSCLMAMAQPTYPITVNILVPNPTSPYVEDYIGFESQIVITLTNNGMETESIKLGGSFLRQSDDYGVRTKASYTPTAPIILGPGASVSLNPNAVYDLSNTGTLEPSGGASLNQYTLNPTLAEGLYLFCINAYDYNSIGFEEPLSNPILPSCASVNPIITSEPLNLNVQGQFCQDELLTIDDNPSTPIVFSWSPSTPAMGMVSYEVTILEFPNNFTDPNMLFNNITSPPVVQEIVTNPNLTLINSGGVFLPGRRYAWRVRAFAPMDDLVFRQDGKSQACSFSFGTMSGFGNGLALNAHWPADGDTIPFKPLFFVTDFLPYNDDYYRFDIDFRLFRGSTEIDQRSDENLWPQGPRQTQSSLMGQPVTEDRSRYTVFSKPDYSIYNLDRMTPHHWEGNGTMRVEGSTDHLVGTCSADFRVGMGRPQPIGPANEAEVPPGTVDFEFLTSREPSRLLPQYPDLVQLEGGNSMSFFLAGLNEKWVLELSRTNAFEEVIWREAGELMDGVATEMDPAALAATLYKNENLSHAVSELGDYFWRIRWLQNPEGADDGPSYLDSPIYKFTITNTPAGDEETAEEDDNCGSDCAAPEIPLARQEPHNSFSIGDTIKVGKFNMVLDQINVNGSKCQGEGSIEIPFLHVKVDVEFNGIEINVQKECFSGSVKTKFDSEISTLVPGLDTTMVALGLSDAGASAFDDYINNASRLVSQLTTDEAVVLPIGWDQTIEGSRFTIGLTKMKFTSERATLQAAFSFDFPDLNGWLSLGADDICFHPQGLASLSQATLYNPLDFVFDVPGSDSDFKMVIEGSGVDGDPLAKTHVSWDCTGFKELKVVGYFNLPRAQFVPDSINGIPGNGNVKAHFNTTFRAHGDYLFGIAIDPFQFAGVPQLAFTASNAFVDHSVSQNPEGIIFPDGYATLGGITGKAWKGFYMGELSCRFSTKDFTGTEDASADERFSFGGSNLLWDDKVSLRVSANNIVRLDQVDINGWHLSVDSLYLDLLRSNFQAIGVTGRLQIPLDDVATLKYTASFMHEPVEADEEEGTEAGMGDGFFLFNVSVQDSLRMNKLGISLEIEGNSFVELRSGGTQKGVTADLTGYLGIDATSEMASSIRGVRIENLVIKTWEEEDADKFSLRTLSFTSPAKSVNNFPIQLNDWGLDVRNSAVNIGDDSSINAVRIGLKFDLGVVIMGDANSFTAGVDFGIYTRYDISGESDFAFAGINLECLRIGGDVGAVRLNGEICFYNNDEVFGNGFRGELSVTMKPGLDVAATVQFGTKSGSRYFYVDAKVELGEGQRITLFPGLAISGFGGGVYVNMRRTGSGPSYGSLDTGTPGTPAHSPTPGASASGTTYVPDPDGGWGLKAAIYFKPPAGDAYKALVQFELEFATGGAFRSFKLNGDLIVLSEGESASSAPIRASLVTEYYDETKIFTLQADIFVNLYDMLKGTGDGNRAGYIDMYVNGMTADWHVFIGYPTPDDMRCGIEVLSLATFQAYIITGKNLPGMPPPPLHIQEAFTQAGLSYTSMRGGINPDQGDGFGTGAYFTTGFHLPVFPLKFDFDFTIGFDVSLRKTTARCRDTGESIGFNDGWYCNGQMYAHMAGGVSLYINLFFFEAEVNIFSAQLAALIQGGFPNPSWANGMASASYSALGGKIHGHWNMAFEFGDVCPLDMGSVFDNIEVIADLQPNNNNAVAYDVVPASAFNFAIDEAFDIDEDNMDGTISVRTFKVLCDDFKVEKTGTGAANLPGTKRVDKFRDPYLIKFIPDAYFSIGSFKSTVKASALEYFPARGWVPVLKDGTTNPVKEEKTANFRVLYLPDTLSNRDISFTYPYRLQRFLLQDECRNGSIAVIRNASVILDEHKDLPADMIWEFRAEMMNMSTGTVVPCEGLTISHNSGTSIRFNIPQLENESNYSFRLVKRKKSTAPEPEPNILLAAVGANSGAFANTNIPQEVQNSSVYMNLLNSNSLIGEHVMSTRRIDGLSVSNANDLLVYQYFFRTSRYNTAQAKVNALVPRAAEKKQEWGTYSSVIEQDMDYSEGFEEFEIKPYVFRHTDFPTITYTAPFSMSILWPGYSNWQVNYAEDKIYKAYRDMKATPCYNGSFYTTYTSRKYRHPSQYQPMFAIGVLGSSLKKPIPKPQPTIITSGGSQPMIGGVPMNNFVGNTSPYNFSNAGGVSNNSLIELAPSTTIKYFTRGLFLIPSDIHTIKQIAATVRVHCNGEFITSEMYNRTQSVLIQQNWDYTSGMYYYNIYYNKYALPGCGFPDHPPVYPVRTLSMNL